MVPSAAWTSRSARCPALGGVDLGRPTVVVGVEQQAVPDALGLIEARPNLPLALVGAEPRCRWTPRRWSTRHAVSGAHCQVATPDVDVRQVLQPHRPVARLPSAVAALPPRRSQSTGEVIIEIANPRRT